MKKVIYLSRLINCVKSPYKKKNYSPVNETCVRRRRLFLPYVFWEKITVPIFGIIHIQNKTVKPCINEGLERRRKVQSFLQGLFAFGANVKERRSRKKEVAWGLNWTKMSWDNACARINSALIIFMTCFNIGNFCAIIRQLYIIFLIS